MATEYDYIAELRRIAPDLAPSISKLTVPAYILDRNAVVRWMNPAGIAAFGDLRGMRIGQIVDREYAARAREEFAGKMLGTIEATEATVVLRAVDGRRVTADISSTQLLDQGSIVGVFGLADPEDEPPPASGRSVHLTPRQLEVLRYIAAGYTTEHVARTLGIAVETVRNHVRGLMSRLDAHTRLEAVMRAHDLDLL